MTNQYEMPRVFKGVWIPASIYLSENLSPKEKLLLIDIDSLDNGERGCFASNAYFANQLQISESQASRLINRLVKIRLITSIIFTQKGKNNERRIHLVNPLSIAFPEISVDSGLFFRNFRGIWIPVGLYLSDRLSPTLKFLLVEIDSLDNGERGCFASNAYFSKFLQVSESQASRLINRLVKDGLVSTDFNGGNGKGTERRLRLVESISIAFPDKAISNEPFMGIRKNAERVSAKVNKGYPQKCAEGIRKSAEHNKPVNKPINKPVKDIVKSTVKRVDPLENFEQNFEEFWAIYPNKKSGKKSPKEILMRKLKTGVRFQAIIESVASHKLTRQWANPQYIPLATTWLNQERWTVEFEAHEFIHTPTSNQQTNRLADNTELDALLDGHRFENAKTIQLLEVHDANVISNQY